MNGNSSKFGRSPGGIPYMQYTQNIKLSRMVKELCLNEPWFRNYSELKFLVKWKNSPRGTSPGGINGGH